LEIWSRPHPGFDFTKLHKFKLIFKNIIFFSVQNAFISPFQHTNNAYLVDCWYTTAWLLLPKKPYTLAGFEPGSSVLVADAVSTMPRRLGILTKKTMMDPFFRFNGTNAIFIITR
jgi:hypothetical protein